MCKSIYLAAPEGLMLVALCGIDAVELARYRQPPTFAAQGGTVPQPDPHARPNFVFPSAMQERLGSLLRMGDEEIAALLSVPTPPVPRRRGAA
jgi:hypothetical protein